MQINTAITGSEVHSNACGKWVAPDQSARSIYCAVTGSEIAKAGNASLDTGAMLDYARKQGGPVLRELSFHDRAKRLKQLALYLKEHTRYLTELAFHSGATARDSTVDIDGGIGTLLVFASKGRRELPDDTICTDGDLEQLSRSGSFVGQHIYTSKPGVAVHINAYNFPVWGMLEKLAPSLLAGMPAIIKPATTTCYVTEACFRLMLDSNTFPPGSFQLICSGTGNLLNQLTAQDMVSFTGSAKTTATLRANNNLLANAIPFNAEQDSLNATVLGEDVTAGSDDFNLFIKEVFNELTVKAGQKCTAIRRIIVPNAMLSDATEALIEKLQTLRIGDPSQDSTTMGALVSQQQRTSVINACEQIAAKASLVYEGSSSGIHDVDSTAGAFITPRLFHCNDPFNATSVHSVEAFGPVSTLMPYTTVDDACALLNLGGGSLVASVVTQDHAIARAITAGSAAWHGRLYFNNQHSGKESTGHGSPLPHMVHGGPGRAGGGEELGGIRAVKHCMQRTAVQGSPDLLQAITNRYIAGATQTSKSDHPFRKTFNALEIGETLHTQSREITLDDIEHFATFTGDTFYAHMDEAAAAANPFFPGRVAHGYLLLSFAAGLFVDPEPGPVLANTGLTDLAFQKPVSPGDSIRVSLTVQQKTKRNEEYGEVKWYVCLFNQFDEQVATYQLHTMVAF